MKINKRFAIGLASALLAATFAFGTNDVVPCFAQDKAPTAPAVDNTASQASATDEKKVDETKVAETQAPTTDEKKADAKEGEKKDDKERESFFGLFGLLWILSLAGSVAALVFAVKFFKTMMKADEGNEEMIKIAAAVRKGANAYLKQQYNVVAIFFVVIWAFLMYLAWGPGVQNKIVPWAFLTGGFFSGLAGWFGMKTATWASSR
ncbi:MAG: sodium/proton-translocating pyrophosphatase, partial [Thermoguttaceae bacterium]|nr:sodium/proton-translocating pyrophosphatase [Thermoguttaceae bacterium]